jgi:site-specific recombinase XerD
MLKTSVANEAAAESRGGDRFAPHLDSFVATLRGLGYAHSTVRERLRLLSDLARWLGRHNLPLADLNELVADQFLEGRRRQGRLRSGDAATLHHFLEHLREVGTIRSPEPAADESPLATLRRQYANHLEKERGLAAVTLAGYWPFIRRFVVEHFGDGPIHVRELAPDDVARFLLRHARSGSPKVAKLMVAALRSFFRFLFQHGQTESDLARAIPTVPGWRLAEVPKYLEPEEVERLVQACQLDTAVARRDHAIVFLLARLGLRASEVIALELDDIDWRAGVLKVRGKGGSHDSLPLPADVGQAMAKYLRHHRPPCTTRRFFIRTKAPHRGLAHPSSISTIVCRALKRAGLQPAFMGAHILRHSLVTGMLRSGASLDEIGEVLRHRGANSTEIYAKVDVRGLRSLALAWPTKGGEL